MGWHKPSLTAGGGMPRSKDMKDIKEVYFKLQEKKKERNGLAKAIRDELANNGEYKTLTEELQRLRERKKSIENQVRADCLSDVTQMDTLRLEIIAANELISDIALTMYANRETVEIVDEEKGIRFTPVFSVKFQKENLDKSEVKSAVKAETDRVEAAATERILATSGALA